MNVRNIRNLVVDIDGTVADHSHRMDLLPKNPAKAKGSEWDAFNADIKDDVAISINVDIITAIANIASDDAHDNNEGFDLTFLTSRNWNTREETHSWLCEWFNFERWGWNLAMRAPDDTRTAADFKHEQLRVWNFDPDETLVFEDNTATALKLREAGYTVYQVADNPY